MELPLRMIAVLVIVILVIIVVSTFFVGQSSQELTRAEANRIFSTSCQNFVSQQCDWSVTKQAGFGEFVDACKFLHGQEREAFSCMYAMCDGCRDFALSDTQCAGRCELLEGRQAAGHDIAGACASYADECSIQCGVCG